MIDTVGCEYHTFAMELLPNEARFLIDSVVVRRFPDRMTPPGNFYSNWITTLPRVPFNLLPAQFGMDYNAKDLYGDTTTLDPYGWWGMKSVTYVERKYFEHAAAFEQAHPVPGWPGFEMVDGKPVAHHMLDYVKVFDVPRDVYVPDLPH
jgi:hypothetical protein